MAKQLVAEHKVSSAEKSTNLPNVFRAVIATVSLGFFNIIFVLGPFIALFSVLISLFAAAFSVVVAGLVSSISAFVVPFLYFGNGITPVMLLGIFFGGIAVMALGIMMGIGVYMLSNLFFRMTLSYLRFNMKIIQGRGDSR